MHLGLDVDVNIWLIAEACTGVISACLPTFRPLLIKIVEVWGKLTRGPTTSDTGAKQNILEGISSSKRTKWSDDTGSFILMTKEIDVEAA